MWAQNASSQVHSAVCDVQKPWVSIKIIRADLPNFLLGEMNHTRQRSPRQGTIDESYEGCTLLRVRDVLRVGERLPHGVFRPLLDLYEFVEPPLLPRPDVIALPLGAIDQFVPMAVVE